MSDSKQHLAELFGLVNPELDEETAAKRQKVGKNAAESIQLGRKALNDGDAQLAVSHYRRAIEQGADDIQFELGAALEASGEDDEAQAAYAAALEKDADLAESRAGLSDIYKRNASFKQAIEELHFAIAKEPSNSFYHLKLAEAHRDLKLYTEAVRAAERAALCDPSNAFYHFWLADLLMEMKKFEEALEPLKYALDLSPGDDYYVHKTAQAFWGAGKKVEALRAARLATDLSPENQLYAAIVFKFESETGKEPGSEAPTLDQYDQDLFNRFCKEIGLEAG